LHLRKPGLHATRFELLIRHSCDPDIAIILQILQYFKSASRIARWSRPAVDRMRKLLKTDVASILTRGRNAVFRTIKGWLLTDERD